MYLHKIYGAKGDKSCKSNKMSWKKEEQRKILGKELDVRELSILATNENNNGKEKKISYMLTKGFVCLFRL